MCLTAADAQKILAGCKAEAAKNKWNVSIAVVDDGGFLVHLERLDGAVAQSAMIATCKAQTAAATRTPTKVLEEIVKERPATVAFPGRVAVQVGLPILYRGECVGGVGVCGAKSHEEEQVARRGLRALEQHCTGPTNVTSISENAQHKVAVLLPPSPKCSS